MRRVLGTLLLATVMLVLPRVSAAADSQATVRVAPFDGGCVVVFQPQAHVGCVAPLTAARDGKLVGASFPTACSGPTSLLFLLSYLPEVCEGQLTQAAFVELRRLPARYMPIASVAAHRRGSLPAVDKYRSTRPQVCVVVLTGAPKTVQWGSCTPLARTGPTTVQLREGGVPLGASVRAYLAAVVVGDASAQIDRITYSLSAR